MRPCLVGVVNVADGRQRIRVFDTDGDEKAVDWMLGLLDGLRSASGCVWFPVGVCLCVCSAPLLPVVAKASGDLGSGLGVASCPSFRTAGSEGNDAGLDFGGFEESVLVDHDEHLDHPVVVGTLATLGSLGT